MGEYSKIGDDSPAGVDSNVGDGVRLIENPMYNNESEVSIPDSVEEAKQQLIGDKSNGPLDAVDNFAQQFAKCWPFGVLKSVNSLFLLLLAIAVLVLRVYSTSWSHHYAYYSANAIDRALALLLLFLAMATFSLLVYWRGRRTTGLVGNGVLLACVATMDFFFSLFIALNLLLFTSVFFALRTFEDINWFIPRFFNESMSLAELTDIRPFNHYNHDFDDFGEYSIYYRDRWLRTTTASSQVPTTTTFSPDQISLMEGRRRKILVRLILDPAILILLALTLLVNIAQMVCIRRTFKRTNLWSSNFRRDVQPNCSDMDERYARFWPMAFLKFLQWVTPLCLLALILYVEDRYRLSYLILVASCCIVSLFQWLLFVRKTRFCSSSAASEKDDVEGHRLSGLFILDLAISLAGLIAYGFIYSFSDSYSCYLNKAAQYMALFALGLCGVNSLFCLWLLHKYKFSLPTDTNIALPSFSFSIKVDFNIPKAENKIKEDSAAKDVGQLAEQSGQIV